MTTTSAELSSHSRFRVLQSLAHARWNERGISASIIVWMAWLISAGWAVWFIASYGINLPYWDEWATIPYLEGQQPITLDWLWSWHNEHRIPLPRILYLISASVAGRDIRGPMFANALILTLVAVLGIAAARRLQGRTRFTDAVIPLSVAGLVNTITLVQGFQIVFVLTTGLFCSIVSLLALSSHALSWRARSLIGVCLLGLPMTGGAGVILAVPLALYLVARGLHDQVRASGASSEIEQGRLQSYGVVTVLVGGAALVEVALYDPLHAPRGAASGTGSHLVATVLGALQFLATAITPDALNGYWWVPAAITAGVALVAALVVARRAIAKGQNRTRAVALLACWAALGMLALGIGYGRGYGLEPRYATLAVSIVFLAYLSVSEADGPAAGVLRWILLISVLAVVPLNLSTATRYGESRREVYSGLRSDIASGMSVDLVADKYYDDIYPDTAISVTSLENLQAFSMGPFVTRDLHLNESPPTVVAEEVVPLDPIVVHDMTKVGDIWQGGSQEPRLTFSFGFRKLAGIRLQYMQTNPSGEPARLQVWWAQNTNSFGQRGDDARVWIDPVGVQHDLTIWIGAKAGALMVQPDIKPTAFKLNRIVLLLAETTPEEEALRAQAVRTIVSRLRDGNLVRTSDLPGIYRMEQGRKRGFLSWQSYLANGGRADMNNVVLLTDDELAAIPDGAPIPAT